MRPALLTILVAAALPAVAQAQIVDPTAGRRLALQWCSECHAVADEQRNPAVDGAPAFRTLANDPKTTEWRLRAFLQTPHPVMPNYNLTRKQTDDIVAYIESLKRR